WDLSSQLGFPGNATPTNAAFGADTVIETFCVGGVAPLWTAANERLVGATAMPGAVERSGEPPPPPPPPPHAATNNTNPAHAKRAPPWKRWNDIVLSPSDRRRFPPGRPAALHDIVVMGGISGMIACGPGKGQTGRAAASRRNVTCLS